jgi:hypothetical protein
MGTPYQGYPGPPPPLWYYHPPPPSSIPQNDTFRSAQGSEFAKSESIIDTSEMTKKHDHVGSSSSSVKTKYKDGSPTRAIDNSREAREGDHPVIISREEHMSLIHTIY